VIKVSDEEVLTLYKKERVQQAKEVIYDINRILDFSIV